MLTPITNVYAPFFRHKCSACGRWTDSPQLMAAEEPWRFVCQAHWTGDDFIRATRAYADQFRAFPPDQKHALRVQLFGRFEAGLIQKREQRC